MSIGNKFLAVALVILCNASILANNEENTCSEGLFEYSNESAIWRNKDCSEENVKVSIKNLSRVAPHGSCLTPGTRIVSFERVDGELTLSKERDGWCWPVLKRSFGQICECPSGDGIQR